MFVFRKWSCYAKSVSKRQNISERYLEQIFSILRKGGIITSKKGAQGGYFLARTAADITVGEILNILEGDLKIVSPSEERNDIECFMQKNIWNNINRQIEEYFDSVTLEALVKDYIEGKIDIMYYI